jgi:hypothetical protein
LKLEKLIEPHFTKGAQKLVGVKSSNASYRQQLAQAKTSQQKAKIVERHLTERFR